MVQKRVLLEATSGELETLAALDTINPAYVGAGVRNGINFLRDDGIFSSVVVGALTYGTGTITFPDDAVSAVNQIICTPITRIVSLPVSFTWNSGAADTTGNILVIVALAASATCLTSLDSGVTWTSVTLPGSITGNVIYANGKFLIYSTVAVFTSYYSTDGVTWNSVAMPASFTLSDVIYGSSKFVGISPSSTSVIYSTDAITWVTQTAAFVDTTAIANVVFTNGIFVRASTAGLFTYTSTTGLVWTKTATNVLDSNLGNPTYLTFANNKFYIINTPAAGLPFLQESVNGVDWTTLSNLLNPNLISDIVYVNGFYVAPKLSASPFTIYLGKSINSLSLLQDASLPTGNNNGLFTNRLNKVFFGGNLTRNYLTYVELINVPTLLAEIPVVIVNKNNIQMTTFIQPGLAQPKKGSTSASVVLTGLAGLGGSDSIQVWIDANDNTSDHNTMEHEIAPIRMSVMSQTAGVGFTVQAISDIRLTGSFKFRYKFGP